MTVMRGIQVAKRRLPLFPIILVRITMKETCLETSGLDPRRFLFSVIKMMQIVGLLGSPEQKWSTGYSFGIMFFIVVQTFTQVMDLILYSRNITTIAQNGIFTLLSINSVFKAAWLWRKQSVVLDLLADINRNFRLTPPSTSDSKGLNAMNSSVRRAYTSFLTLTTLAYVYWIGGPFLQYATVLYGRNSSRDNFTDEYPAIYEVGYALPAPAWFPFQVFYFPVYYVAYAFQFVSLTYIVFISISVDLFCIVTLLRINVQLQFLVSDIEMASGNAWAAIRGVAGSEVRLFQRGGVGTTTGGFMDELIGIARICVDRHVVIIRVIRQFDEVLGGIAYMTTRIYTLILIAGAMKIVEAHGIDANTVQLMVYWMCFLYQLYLFYSPADDIIYSQNLLANGVEEGLWIPTSTSNKKLAYIITRITMMANKPAHFSAWYLHMNRTTYRTEIQHVASMFNALWQMKNGGRV